ncbi:NAD-dependent epimerase/dehydratase family protein [Olivibacter sp. XZL3]|uniref:NAD-dependent epimerase/dehydratase family protein n=1 Tax=Olivibacter sp. XZL3 TaxID=1735116 RepID=UPI00106706F5|nr:NAD-dependent epimerase/dehydratase family protein [Olivibacter sp. XZL3]
MRLLYTGPSGFVGRNLAEVFAGRYELFPFSLNRDDWTGKWPNDVDVVVHLAGKAHDVKKVARPEDYIEINTNLTKRVFTEFLASSARDFIFLSSVKAIADTVENSPLTEEAPPRPLTPYGRSKLQAEEYLLSKALPPDKRLFILRPCMIHGPGNKGNLNLLYSVVKKGIPYPLGAFTNLRSFLSIGNLLFVIESIINKSEIPSGVYNVADDTPLSTTEVIKVIGEVSGKKVRIYSPNKGLIRALARIGDILHLPFNSERLKKMTESYIVSNEKIKRAIDIESLPISSREGLKNTIKSFDI